MHGTNAEQLKMSNFYEQDLSFEALIKDMQVLVLK